MDCRRRIRAGRSSTRTGEGAMNTKILRCGIGVLSCVLLAGAGCHEQAPEPRPGAEQQPVPEPKGATDKDELQDFGPDPKGRGLAEARRDIAAGKLRLKTYGLPRDYGRPEVECGLYEKVAKERLGLEMERIAECVVTESLVA